MSRVTGVQQHYGHSISRCILNVDHFINFMSLFDQYNIVRCDVSYAILNTYQEKHMRPDDTARFVDLLVSS